VDVRRIRPEIWSSATAVSEDGPLMTVYYTREVDVDTGEAGPWHKIESRPLRAPIDRGPIEGDPPNYPRERNKE